MRLLGLLFGLLVAAAVSVNFQPASGFTVHVIPHSHCDPGWLESFEGYFTRKVNKILTNVVTQLRGQPSRRFVWAEMSFFMRWFSVQDRDVQNLVHELVQSGQLEFVGGGWVQNDEANPHPEAVIDQVTEGHEYLYSLFGVRPRIAWQIDPFGHSSATPALFAHAGYDALVINRIHYSIKQHYKQTRAMEFVWRTDSMGTDDTVPSSDMFTHVLHTHYSAPRGFDFEESNAHRFTPSNMKSAVNSFVSQMKARIKAYRTNHLLVPFGDDFKFVQAGRQFSNMDSIIKYINSHNMGMTVKYSTLSEYFDAVRADAAAIDAKFPVFTGDFFPYFDNGDSAWVGYYSTRPALKSSVRSTRAVVRGADILFALARPHASVWASPSSAGYNWLSAFRSLEAARLDLALVLHHDGITGTARDHVVKDYASRLNRATDDARRVLGDVAALLLCKDSANQPPLTHVAAPAGVSSTGEPVERPVVVVNSLGWRRVERVAVPIRVDNNQPWPKAYVVDASGNPVPSQLQIKLTEGSADKALVFLADLPPLGITTYFYTLLPADADDVAGQSMAAQVVASLYGTAAKGSSHSKVMPPAAAGRVTIHTPCVDLTVSATTGELQAFRPYPLKGTLAVRQSMRYYVTRRSGAYLFRPESKRANEMTNKQTVVAVIDGPVVKEIQVVGSNWQQVIRIPVAPSNKTCLALDATYTVPELRLTTRPIQTNNEVVTEFVTSFPVGPTVSSKEGVAGEGDRTGRFLTDNGLQLIHRPRANRDDPVAKSYYPMNSAAVLTAARKTAPAKETSLMVLSRQPLGVTSRVADRTVGDGQTKAGATLEIMVHRRLAKDDGRGLAQGVEDSSVVEFPFLLLAGGHARLSQQWRRRSMTFHNPVEVLYGLSTPKTDSLLPRTAWTDAFFTRYTPLKEPLPPNLHISTLKTRNAVTDEVALRLWSLNSKPGSVPLDLLDVDHDREDLTTGFGDVGDGDEAAQASFQSHFEFVRPRTLTLNRPETHLHLTRQLFPVDEADKAAEAKHKVHTDEALTLDSAENQNTEEEGVFISQAALEKQAEDRRSPGGGRRRLLAVDTPSQATLGGVPSLEVRGNQVRSFIAVIRPLGGVEKEEDAGAGAGGGAPTAATGGDEEEEDPALFGGEDEAPAPAAEAPAAVPQPEPAVAAPPSGPTAFAPAAAPAAAANKAPTAFAPAAPAPPSAANPPTAFAPAAPAPPAAAQPPTAFAPPPAPAPAAAAPNSVWDTPGDNAAPAGGPSSPWADSPADGADDGGVVSRQEGVAPSAAVPAAPAAVPPATAGRQAQEETDRLRQQPITPPQPIIANAVPPADSSSFFMELFVLFVLVACCCLVVCLRPAWLAPIRQLVSSGGRGGEEAKQL